MVRRGSTDSLKDILGGDAISDTEPIEFDEHLPNGGGKQEFLRRSAVAGITGAVVVDAHPALREDVDALDGIYRPIRRNFGHRAAVGVARMDTPAGCVGRVAHGLPALAEESFDKFHLGVRCPENPDPVLPHEFLHFVFAGAHLRGRAWDPAYPAGPAGQSR